MQFLISGPHLFRILIFWIPIEITSWKELFPDKDFKFLHFSKKRGRERSMNHAVYVARSCAPCVLVIPGYFGPRPRPLYITTTVHQNRGYGRAAAIRRDIN